jgi:glycosyltransferase involved in cell wall biosynthesis
MFAPLCSIVVSSYNKAAYVGLAVESALSQTYPKTEVIVVDDGSSDTSLAVLEHYSNRVTLIAKPNGGQASAMNRGFLASGGEIVLFLDCDDLLDPDVVERVVAIWTPELSKVHFRLRQIRGDGREIMGKVAPPYRPLTNEDITSTFRRFGFYPAPPTTGNAFARRVLDAVMPLPEPAYRGWPDTVLIGVAPLFGTVAALQGTGGCWRRTEGNYSNGGLEKVAAKLNCDRLYIDIARRVSKDTLPAGFAALWPQHLKDSLILMKFSPSGTFAVSKILKTTTTYLWAIARWPEYTWRERILFGAWGLAIGLVPARLLRLVPGIAGPNIVLHSN